MSSGPLLRPAWIECLFVLAMSHCPLDKGTLVQDYSSMDSNFQRNTGHINSEQSLLKDYWPNLFSFYIIEANNNLSSYLGIVALFNDYPHCASFHANEYTLFALDWCVCKSQYKVNFVDIFSALLKKIRIWHQFQDKPISLNFWLKQ